MAPCQSERRATPSGRSLVLVVALATATLGSGCGDDGGSTPTESATADPTTSVTTTEPDPGSSTTGAAESSTAAVDSSSGDDTVTPPETTGPPPPPTYCSLEAVDPTADPEGLIDMGEGEGQIPMLIGEAMLRNCGCHYTDKAFDNGYVGYIDDGRTSIHLSALADFHLLFTGTFPMDYEDRPMYEAMEVRVIDQLPLPMPSEGCDVDGERGVITAADKALFAAWLEQDAPDAVTFVPPKG